MTIEEKIATYKKTACSQCGREMFYAVVEAIESERERCARIAESFDSGGAIAAEIRKGGES